jgi:hypothetical protein
MRHAATRTTFFGRTASLLRARRRGRGDPSWATPADYQRAGGVARSVAV